MHPLSEKADRKWIDPLAFCSNFMNINMWSYNSNLFKLYSEWFSKLLCNTFCDVNVYNLCFAKIRVMRFIPDSELERQKHGKKKINRKQLKLEYLKKICSNIQWYWEDQQHPSNHSRTLWKQKQHYLLEKFMNFTRRTFLSTNRFTTKVSES